jgi:ComF family protein
MHQAADGSRLCGECLRRPPDYQHSVIPFLYAPPLTYLIKQMKFHRRLDLARGVGRLMADYLAERPDALPEVMIPVPLHPRRMRRRGYNQALELARPLASVLDLPIDTRMVRRQRATAEQSHLEMPLRRRNVQKAFVLNRQRPYRHVAIVDDVVTSGHTVNELARVLRLAGVERVDVWSCCRATGREE